jgi:hypothetical protein
MSPHLATCLRHHHQADINEKMRGILIDWLVEVHLKFKVSGWLESGEQLQGLQMGRWAAVSSEVM